MIKVEYLVFNENESIKCVDSRTFNHLLQSDPQIKITESELVFNELPISYIIKTGKVKNTENNYFHLKSLRCILVLLYHER